MAGPMNGAMYNPYYGAYQDQFASQSYSPYGL